METVSRSLLTGMASRGQSCCCFFDSSGSTGPSGRETTTPTVQETPVNSIPTQMPVKTNAGQQLSIIP